MRDAREPTMLLKINSIIVISLGILWTCLAVLWATMILPEQYAKFSTQWKLDAHPLRLVSVVISVCFFVGAALMGVAISMFQYAATFRRNAAAARSLVKVFFFFGRSICAHRRCMYFRRYVFYRTWHNASWFRNRGLFSILRCAYQGLGVSNTCAIPA